MREKGHIRVEKRAGKAEGFVVFVSQLFIRISRDPAHNLRLCISLSRIPLHYNHTATPKRTASTKNVVRTSKQNNLPRVPRRRARRVSHLHAPLLHHPPTNPHALPPPLRRHMPADLAHPLWHPAQHVSVLPRRSLRDRARRGRL